MWVFQRIRFDRLFKPFSQIDVSTTRNYGGTGLGLAISRRLAQCMHGLTWVTSELGKGSCFHFTATVDVSPVHYTQHMEPSRISHLSDETQLLQLIRQSFPTTPLTILICEPNSKSTAFLYSCLTSWGARVIGCEIENLREEIIANHAHAALVPKEAASDATSVIRSMNLTRTFCVVSLSGIHAPLRTRADSTLDSPLNNNPRSSVDDSIGLVKPVKRSALVKGLVSIISKVSDRAIEIPSSTVVEVKQVKTSSTTKSILTSSESTCSLRVLVAEDNPINQKVAAKILSMLHHKVDVAWNGAEAVGKVQSNTYDVILMDMQMPEMDGLDATRMICQRWPDTRPKIVGLTANATQDDRDRCLESGMDFYLPKPVNIKALHGVLTQCAALTKGKRPAQK